MVGRGGLYTRVCLHLIGLTSVTCACIYISDTNAASGLVSDEFTWVSAFFVSICLMEEEGGHLGVCQFLPFSGRLLSNLSILGNAVD